MPKNIAIFFDGTWNRVSDNTNVWRAKSLLAKQSKKGKPQIAYYDIGVNGVIGGGFGQGVGDNITQAYEWLVENFQSGDDLFVFGFSRGAFTARSLVGFIAQYGLIELGTALGVKQLYERYRRNERDRTIRTLIDDQNNKKGPAPTLEESWMLKYARPIDIKFIGVWDTVGALGVPLFKVPGISSNTLVFHHTGLRIPLKYAFHALAIDDHRRKFAPTLWTVNTKKADGSDHLKVRPIENAEQRWFVGAHANVGGGCMSDTLAQRPLEWMISKATLHGLDFEGDLNVDKDVLTPISDSYRDFLWGAYRGFSWRYYRPIGSGSYQDERGTQTYVNETIDASVFERWRIDSRYRPDNLVEWAKRNGAKPEELHSSVFAANYKQTAPE